MSFAEDRIRWVTSVRAVSTNRSSKAFASGLRGRIFTAWVPMLARTGRECGRLVRAAHRTSLCGHVLDAEDIPDEQAAKADDELLAAERHAALRDALADLPPPCRRLIVLLARDPPVPSQIDRIAGRQPLIGAGHHLPGVHAGADAHRGAEVGLQFPVELCDVCAQPGCGAYRPQRIVLMQHRDTENGHHRVSDELLHRAAMMFDNAAGSIEIPPHDLPEALRIQQLPQSRQPRHIAKQHRHRLALLARRDRHQSRAALAAEPCILRVRPTARGANLHTSQAKPSPLNAAAKTLTCPLRSSVRNKLSSPSVAMLRQARTGRSAAASFRRRQVPARTRIGREDVGSASGPASPVLSWWGRSVGNLGPGLTSESADAASGCLANDLSAGPQFFWHPPAVPA